MFNTIVVGITGGSASGKTTITKQIESGLTSRKIKIFHGDHYFKEKKPMITAPITGKVYEDHNHPLTIDLPRLFADIKATKESGDFEVIIVEGILIFFDQAVRSLIDYKIFVDCQADERIVRRIKRQLACGQSFDDITSVYLDAVRYRHNEFVEPTKWHADVILNGSAMPQKGIDTVLVYINSLL